MFDNFCSEQDTGLDYPGLSAMSAGQIVVVTTLNDGERYPRAEIAGLFRACWHVELDLRSINVNLHLDDVRCKTPEMVRREIPVHWLAYNLTPKWLKGH